MIKVLHIISTGALAGTERSLIDLISYDKNIEVLVICPSNSLLAKELTNLGIPILEVSFNLKNIIFTLFKVYACIKNWKPQIVHTHLGRAMLVGAVTAKFAKVKIILTTFQFIKPAYVSSRSKIFYPLFLAGHKIINKSFTKIIVISQAVLDETIRREKVPLEKLILIPHGTVLTNTKLSQKNKEFLKDILGIDYNAKIVITVARLEKEKGYNNLITAASKILEKHPTTQFLLVGDGSQRSLLEQSLESLHISENVKILGFRKDVLSLLLLADVFVLASPAEPFGIAVIEAMNCSLPVVAIKAGGPAEIVIDGETGKLVLANSDLLAEAICELLENPEKAKQMGKAGKLRCTNVYSIESMVRNTEKLYLNLLRIKTPNSL